MALFLLAFGLRAASLDTSYFFWDESIYLMQARLFAGQAAGYSETFLRPPLLPLTISPLTHFSPGQYELAARLLLAFLNSLVVFPIFFFTKSEFSRKANVGCRVDKGGSEATALIAASVAAFLPALVLNSRWVMTDGLGALLAFSSVVAYVLGLQRFAAAKRAVRFPPGLFAAAKRAVRFPPGLFAAAKRAVLMWFGGVLAGLAVLMKFTNLLLAVLLLPLLLASVRKRFAAVTVSVLLFAAVMLPYLAFSFVSFGSPLYAFGRAFQAVAEPSPVSFGFFLWLLWDSFGVLLAFLAVGIAVSAYSLFRERSRSTILFLFFCLAVTLVYFFFIIQKGVVKPAGIEWEVERFLLLFALFAIPFIGFGVVKCAVFARQMLPLRFAGAVTLAVAAAVFLSLYPQLARAYAPAITFEDGLRDVAKAAGVYLGSGNITEFGCLGNCPPVAYYSGSKMSLYFSNDGLAAANHSRVVVFDNPKDSFLGGYSVEKEFCSRKHCAYVLLRR